MKGAIAVSAVLGALIAGGAVWAIGTAPGTNAPPISTATLTDNTIIIIGAESYGQKPEDFLKIVEGVASHDKKSW